ncbi:hypothetical protein HRG_013791 [Hirsutella rhossiliensis]
MEPSDLNPDVGSGLGMTPKPEAPMPTPTVVRYSRFRLGSRCNICQVCSPRKTFARVEHLRRHQSSHEPPSLRCPQRGCMRRFYRLDLLERHGHGSRDENEYGEVSWVYGVKTTQQARGLNDFFKAVFPVANESKPVSIFAEHTLSSPAAVLNPSSDATIPDSGYGSHHASGNREQEKQAWRETLEEAAGSVGTAELSGSQLVLSRVSTIQDSMLALYVSVFAEEIAAVLSRTIPVNQLHELSAALPGLLMEFAYRDSHHRRDYVNSLEDSRLLEAHLEASVTVCRFRIENAVLKTLLTEQREGNNGALIETAGNTTSDVDNMSLWQGKEYDSEQDTADRLSWVHTTGMDNDFDDFPHMQAYLHDLLRSPAFTWLLGSVQRQVEWRVPGVQNSQAEIRQRILDRLFFLDVLTETGWILNTSFELNERILPAPSKSLFHVEFQHPWIEDFFVSQGYDIPAHEALERVLVLTGDDRNAWATTCRQYVQSVWPDFGPRLLDVYKSLLQDGMSFLHSRKSHDLSSSLVEIAD